MLGIKSTGGRDGISEVILDGVAVQRVEDRMLECAELSGFSWCNTNNHRDTDTFRKLDGSQFTAWYRGVLEQTSMEKWSDSLGCLCGDRFVHGHVLIISARQQQQYFGPAAELAKQGVCAGRLLKEETEELRLELEAFVGATFAPPPHGWFVRATACSPKDAMCDGAAGPHHSIDSVLSALLGSERIHRSMKGYDTDMKVFLMPFDSTITTRRELRVFVCDEHVTAMSQYDIFNPSVFSQMSDGELAEVAHRVDSFHRESVVPKWRAVCGIASYVMDVEYVVTSEADWQVRIIELNSFGPELAAASALFHWVDDFTEMHCARRLCIRVRGPD